MIAFAWAIRAEVSILSPGNPNPFITPLAVLVSLLAVGFVLVRSGRFGRSRMADVSLALGVVLVGAAVVIEVGTRGGDARRAAHVAHMAAGMLITIPVHLYFFAHLASAFRRRPLRLVRSGFASLGLALAAIWTGILVLVFQAPDVQPLSRYHGWLGWALLPLIVFHTWHGRRALAAQGEAEPVARRALAIAGGGLAVLVAVVLVYDRATPVEPPHHRPGAPLPEAALALTEARTESGRLLSASVHNRPFATCGSFDTYCHVDNVNQWKRSAHNHSANPAYRAVLERFEADRPGSGAYCASCHQPFEVLAEAPADGELAELDGGVGCTLCHSIRPRRDVEGTGSYVLRPVSAHFARLSPIVFFAFPLVLADLDLHSAELLSAEVVSPDACATCHRHRVPDAVHPGIPGFEVTDKVEPWRVGPRGPEGSEPTPCADCHMSPIYGPIDPMTTRSHAFPSGNTGVPWLLGLEERVEENRRFLASDKVELAAECAPAGEVGGFSCRVEVANLGVGHDFPSGLQDVVEVWVEATLVDSSGGTLWRAGGLDEDGRIVDPPISYRQRFEDAEGRALVAHEFWKVTRVTGRASIPPGGRDREQLALPPVDGASRLVLRLRHRRYNPEFTAEVLRRDPREVPITLLDELEVRLGTGPAVP